MICPICSATVEVAGQHRCGESLCDYIKVWRFCEAPHFYQKLSKNGGDEDWVAFISDAWLERHRYVPSWMQEGGRFGCCTVDEIQVEGGTIYIGCHA